ncbi:hypothetical protein CLV86_0139 [Lacinutrix venerupis]|uniref:hypothetical protein n=1 Tax=Lacinutrix venerupis TaxID=1486034 RepID=UPI000EB3476A|nr:hypothetical protein [Lacinutrix venerupis]RLJ68750.1 hypothetical protein CLV86_0139 [Lacinutrix venerupis]
MPALAIETISTLLIIGVLVLVMIPYILQRIKLKKEETLLKEQDKKLEEMLNRQNKSAKPEYDDFTNGHLYE